MEHKIKASKKNIKKKTDFSRKEKAITRYTRMEGTTENKLYFHCGPSTKAVEM